MCRSKFRETDPASDPGVLRQYQYGRCGGDPNDGQIGMSAPFFMFIPFAYVVEMRHTKMGVRWTMIIPERFLNEGERKGGGEGGKPAYRHGIDER